MRLVKLAVLALTVFLCGCGGVGSSLLLGDSYNDGYYGTGLVAYDDEYFTVQNLPLTVGAFDGLLANDIVCCENYEVRYPQTTASGGSLSIQKDGSFVYSPPRNFVGTDFFEYRLKDRDGESVAQVVIFVDFPEGGNFVVDNSNGNDSTGSGQSGAPFASIQAAVMAAGNNAVIVIRRGTGAAYGGNITLLQGQTLVGEGFQNDTQGALRPRLSGSIAMGDGCTLRGLRLEGGAIDGVLRFDGSITQCEIVGASPIAIDLDGAEGEWTVQECVVENGAEGISVTLIGLEQLKVLLDSNTMRNNTGRGLFLSTSDNARLTAGVLKNTFQNNLVGGSMVAEAGDSSTLALDLSQNQSNDTYLLANDGATFQVEQSLELGTINSGNVTISLDALTNLANGSLGF